jgi:hypothetical protein
MQTVNVIIFVCVHTASTLKLLFKFTKHIIFLSKKSNANSLLS